MLTTEMMKEFGKFHAEIHKEWLASGQDVTLSQAADRVVTRREQAEKESAEAKPQPQRMKGRGALGYHSVEHDHCDECDLRPKCVPVDAPQPSAVKTGFIPSTPRDWTREIEVGDKDTNNGTGGRDLYSKRPDCPGDGFVHLDHQEWGVGVWLRGNIVYFPLVNQWSPDRSKLIRVYAVRS